MPKYAQAYDGRIVEFDDATPQHVIDMVMKRDFSIPPPPPPPKDQNPHNILTELGVAGQAIIPHAQMGLSQALSGLAAIQRGAFGEVGDSAQHRQQFEKDMAAMQAAGKSASPQLTTPIEQLGGMAGEIIPALGPQAMGVMMGQQYQNALDAAAAKGLSGTPQAQLNAAGQGAFGAVMGGLPFGEIGETAAKFIPGVGGALANKGLLGMVARPGVAAASDALGFGGLQVGQNLLTGATINPGQNPFENVPESMAQGALFGGLMHGAGEVINRKKILEELNKKNPEPPPPPGGTMEEPPPAGGAAQTAYGETAAPHPDPAHPSNILSNWHELPAGMQEEMLRDYQASTPTGSGTPTPEGASPPTPETLPSVEQTPTASPGEQPPPVETSAPPASIEATEPVQTPSPSPTPTVTPEAGPVSDPRNKTDAMVNGSQGPKLPEELAKAQPRFNVGDISHTPQFESDIDKALYITAGAKKSASDGKYRSWLEGLGYTPDQIDQQGQLVRRTVSQSAREVGVNGDVLDNHPIPQIAPPPDDVRKAPEGSGAGVDPDMLLAKGRGSEDASRPTVAKDEQGYWHVEYTDPHTGTLTRDYHNVMGDELNSKKMAKDHADYVHDQIKDEIVKTEFQPEFQTRTDPNILRDAGFTDHEIEDHQWGADYLDQPAALAEKGWMHDPTTAKWGPATPEIVSRLKDTNHPALESAQRQLKRSIENNQIPTPDTTSRLSPAPYTYMYEGNRNDGWVRNPIDIADLENKVQGQTPDKVASIIAKRNASTPLGLIAKRVEQKLSDQIAAGVDHQFQVVQPSDMANLPQIVQDHLSNHGTMAGNARRFLDENGNPKLATTTYVKGSSFGTKSGMGDEVILHELIHGVTSHALQLMEAHDNPLDRGYKNLTPEDVKFYSEIKRISGVIGEELTRRLDQHKNGVRDLTPIERAVLDKNGSNALENAHEILAWGLTDRGFQDMLESIRDTGGQNLFNKFVNAIRELLGLPAKSNTALASLLHVADGMLSAPGDHAQGLYDKYMNGPKAVDHTAPSLSEAVANNVFTAEQTKDGLDGLSKIQDGISLAKSSIENGDYSGTKGLTTGKLDEMILRRAMMPEWQTRKGVLARSAGLLSKVGVSREALDIALKNGVLLGSDKNGMLAVLQKDVLLNGKVKMMDENTPLVASDLAPQTIQARVEAFRAGAYKELTKRMNDLAPYAHSQAEALAKHLEGLGIKDNVIRSYQDLKKPAAQILADAYAYARHAEEANKYGLDVLKKQIGEDDQGNPIYDPKTSGMSDEEARAIKDYVDNLPHNQREAIYKTQAQMRFIADERERIAIADGIMPDWKKIRSDFITQSKDLTDKLNNVKDPFVKERLERQLESINKQINKIPDFKDYVPLKSDYDSVERDAYGNPVDPNNWGGFSGGNSTSVKGKESINRLGRGSYAGQITNNLVTDYENSQSRGVRNQAGQRLMNLIADGYKSGDEYIMKHFDEPSKIQPQAYKDSTTGEVKYSVADYRNQPDAFITKFGGKEMYARIKTPEMMATINGFDGTTGKFMKMVEGFDQGISNFTGLQNWGRAFHLLNAGASFPFAARLILKHTDVAKLNVMGLGKYFDVSDQKLRSGIDKHTWTIGRSFLGVKPDPSVQADLAELRANGGLFKPVDLGGVENIQDHLDNIFAPEKWKDKTAREKWLAFKGGVHKLEQSITSFTNHVEWTTRLAVYRTMKENGASPKEAAWYAQELTGNFGRKGLATRALASLYPFYNAGVQADNASLSSVLKGGPKLLAKTAGSLAGLGAMIAMYNYWMGGMYKDQAGNNPYALLPSYKRAGTSLAIQVPFMHEKDGSPYYYKAPTPFKLFSLPINAGAAGVAMLHGDVTPGEYATEFANELISSGAHYSSTPTANPLVSATPGALRGLTSLGTNRTELGAPIHPEFPTARQKPQSQIYTKHASEASIAVANALHKGGLAEIYPDDLDYISATTAGSAGSFALGIGNAVASFVVPNSSANREIRGRDPYNQITDNPVSGIFVSRISSGDVANKYYSSVKEIEDYKTKLTSAKSEGDHEEALRLAADHPKEASMLNYYKRVENEMKDNRKALKDLQKNTTLSVADKVTRAEHINQANELLQRQFIYRWHNNGKYPDLSDR